MRGGDCSARTPASAVLLPPPSGQAFAIADRFEAEVGGVVSSWGKEGGGGGDKSMGLVHAKASALDELKYCIRVSIAWLQEWSKREENRPVDDECKVDE